MNNEYLMLKGALRVFNDFSQSGCDDYYVEHDVKNLKFELLRKDYRILEIADSGNDFSKAINLMQWVHDNLLRCGSGGGVDV